MRHKEHTRGWSSKYGYDVAIELKLLRYEHGDIPQSVLASLTGIPLDTISKIESGRTGATARTIQRIAEVYGRDWLRTVSDIRRKYSERKDVVTVEEFPYYCIIHGAY